MTETLQKFADLLRDDRKALAHLGTVMSDGAPQVTPSGSTTTALSSG